MSCRPSETGEIINTRVSDYVNVSSSRIMNLLHLWLPWTWLPLTTLQASGSVWNSFQVGVIFFPLTFCSWGGPKEEAEERNIAKYVLSPCLYVLFPQEKKADAGQGELANENVATAGSFWQWRPWSDTMVLKKGNCWCPTSGNLCIATGQSVTIFVCVCYQLFQRNCPCVGLPLSKALE